MSWFSSLFGSKEVIKDGMQMADEAFYTDQEDAELGLKHVEAKINVIRAYEPFKKAQRFMMLIVMPPYCLAWFATFCASFFIDVDKQITLLTSTTGLPAIALAIAVFYFGGGVIESMKRKINKQ